MIFEIRCYASQSETIQALIHQVHKSYHITNQHYFLLKNSAFIPKALLANNSLQHLFLGRCLIGDAGCLAVCKAVRCLPNILTLDLSGCELTLQGAGYIADLVKVTGPTAS